VVVGGREYVVDVFPSLPFPLAFLTLPPHEQVILTVFSSTLLSAKTAKKRKIVQASNLSALAAELGGEAFIQIEFPLEVYTYVSPSLPPAFPVSSIHSLTLISVSSANATTDASIKLPPSNPPLQKTFDVPLEEVRFSLRFSSKP
jgi:hypothetical protein